VYTGTLVLASEDSGLEDNTKEEELADGVGTSPLSSSSFLMMMFPGIVLSSSYRVLRFLRMGMAVASREGEEIDEIDVLGDTDETNVDCRVDDTDSGDMGSIEGTAGENAASRERLCACRARA
jgi:hypothetical protein